MTFKYSSLWKAQTSVATVKETWLYCTHLALWVAFEQPEVSVSNFICTVLVPAHLIVFTLCCVRGETKTQTRNKAWKWTVLSLCLSWGAPRVDQLLAPFCLYIEIVVSAILYVLQGLLTIFASKPIVKQDVSFLRSLLTHLESAAEESQLPWKCSWAANRVRVSKLTLSCTRRDTMSDLAADCEHAPFQLMERVLSFLSAPVLFRFRTVCKRWNSLICKPPFGALCIHHARQDPSFIVVREETQWCFLDMIARRWYTIKDCGSFDRSTIGPVAMDGGLVCQLSSASLKEDASVYVSSPIAKTSRRLPPCTAMARRTSRPVLDMVVDTVALTFKIFLIPDGAEIQPIRGGRHFMVNKSAKKPPISEENPFMVVYESATNLWRNSIPHMPLQGLNSRATCSVFIEGLCDDYAQATVSLSSTHCVR